MYNYNHLYYFYIAAKSGGINSAAKHLKISQPSLTSQIKVLERSLKIQLFQKVGRRVQLTPDGSVVFGYCRRMFEVSEEMHEEISKQVPVGSRRIHVGISSEVDRPFVIEVISSYLKNHGLAQMPKVTVVSGTHELLVERLRFRELDAIVTKQAMIATELVNLKQIEVPVNLTCSTKWELGAKTSNLKVASAIKRLVGGENARWIMPAPSFKLRAEIDHFFEENDLRGRIVFESDVMASMVRAVIDEIGLAFLPRLYIAREIQEKSIQILGPKKGYWKYTVCLACHHQSENDPAIQTFSKSFTEVCKGSI